MGNCVPSHALGRVSEEFTGEEEFIMVTRSDGKIMEYTPPLLARDLMATYPQHSLVHSENATCLSLSPEQKLVPGQLYRLLLIPNSPSLSKEAVLSEATSTDNGGSTREKRASTRLASSVKCVQNDSGTVRVKMVISKRKLEALLSECSGKEKTVEQVMMQLQCKGKEEQVAKRCCAGWRPSLQSIPEAN